MTNQTSDKHHGAARAPDAGSGGVDKGTEPRLPFPHERDEAADQQGHPVEPVIEQARKDISGGLQDTDLRGTAAEKFDGRFGPRRRHGTP